MTVAEDEVVGVSMTMTIINAATAAEDGVVCGSAMTIINAATARKAGIIVLIPEYKNILALAFLSERAQTFLEKNIVKSRMKETIINTATVMTVMMTESVFRRVLRSFKKFLESISMEHKINKKNFFFKLQIQFNLLKYHMYITSIFPYNLFFKYILLCPVTLLT